MKYFSDGLQFLKIQYIKTTLEGPEDLLKLQIDFGGIKLTIDSALMLPKSV